MQYILAFVAASGCLIGAFIGFLIGKGSAKKSWKASRDLHLKARVKAETAYESMKGRYLVMKNMAEKALDIRK